MSGPVFLSMAEQLYKVWASERWRQIFNVFSHWLRPCSTIDKTCPDDELPVTVLTTPINLVCLILSAPRHPAAECLLPHDAGHPLEELGNHDPGENNKILHHLDIDGLV